MICVAYVKCSFWVTEYMGTWAKNVEKGFPKETSKQERKINIKELPRQWREYHQDGRIVFCSVYGVTGPRGPV